MNYRILYIIFAIALLASSCVHTANLKKIDKMNGNNIAAISLLTDEAKCSLGTGMFADTIYAEDTGWNINKKINSIISQQIEYSGNISSIDFDLKSIDEIYEKQYKTLPQAIVGKFLENNQDTDIDIFLVLYPNAIDVRGRQYSPAMNFGLMGPLGVLLGEIGRRNDTFTPIINIYKPTKSERIMIGEKPRCQLGYNLYAISRNSQQIIGQKENIRCKEVLESDFWPEGVTSFQQLNLPYLQEKCLAGISMSIAESLGEIGL